MEKVNEIEVDPKNCTTPLFKISHKEEANEIGTQN
jgi:hypothetical protein